MPRLNSWQAIHDDLRRRIIDGKWLPGQLIPGEVELAEQFGCSRTTVNRALRELAATGVIDRKRKAGTRVAKQRAQRATVEIPVIKLQVELLEKEYSFRVMHQKKSVPPGVMRERLALPSNTKALHIRTLHMADGSPFIYEDRWVNIHTVPLILKADLSVISVNEWLVTHVPLSKGELFLSASVASKTIAKILKLDAESPLLLLSRLTWLDGKSVTAAKLYHEPGHQIRLQI